MSNDSNEDQALLVDESVLGELQEIMEDEYVEILQIYLDESVKLMSDIHAGFTDEPENLLRAVHTLKSSSNNVGAKRLAEVSKKMEDLVRTGDVDSAKSFENELDEVFTESHSALKSYADGNGLNAAM